MLKKSKFYCKLHGDNNTHDTNHCTTCDKVIAKLKSDKDNKRKSGENPLVLRIQNPPLKKYPGLSPQKRRVFQDSIGKVVAAAVAATLQMGKTDKTCTEQEFNNLTLSNSEKSERTVESVAESDSD